METMNLQDHQLKGDYFRGIFEAVAGYALGTSLVSIFTRVSGGVFAAASEVGAELAGKMEGGLPYNSAQNAATVTESAGENIGELLGGVAEFASSLTETVCVVFVLSCTSLAGYHNETAPCSYFISNFMYPLMAIALGQFFSMAVSSIATNFIWIESLQQAQSIMRIQLLLIALVMLGSLYLSAYVTFPSQFTISNIYERYYDLFQPWIPYVCSVIGIASAVLLCMFNEFFASPAFFPIQSLV
jgi:Na+/H+-translocating membrane pyrophosphatase